MLFNSSAFLVFFLITFIIYYLPRFQQSQVLILVVASFIFYGWSSPNLLILLLISILINAFTSFKVFHAPENRQLLWALIGVAINLAILALFKYGVLLTNLFIGLTNTANVSSSSVVQSLLHLPLPVGISFYTFEGISLVVDVLRQKQHTSKHGVETKGSYVHPILGGHIFNTSFFVAFFPHLIAGPILKANSFYPQIGSKSFSDIQWKVVFHSLVVGYFLKMVVADNLKDYTFWIAFPHYQSLGSLTNIALIVGYSMQIFADFAGYSLIAIGLAAALGYVLPQNFDFPYISRSITEFWRRWHISLSTWLRDYLYIPLGGNRKGKFRTYINLMVVMGLGGLWHGASWSYGVWGIFHGAGLALERLFGIGQKPKNNLEEETKHNWWQFLLESAKILFVFVFVSLGWLLFKLPRFDQAIGFLTTTVHNIDVSPNFKLINPIIVFSIPVIVYHIIHVPILEQYITTQSGQLKRKIVNLCVDIALGAMLAVLFLNSGNSDAFIYFQF